MQTLQIGGQPEPLPNFVLVGFAEIGLITNEKPAAALKRLAGGLGNLALNITPSGGYHIGQIFHDMKPVRHDPRLRQASGHDLFISVIKTVFIKQQLFLLSCFCEETLTATTGRSVMRPVAGMRRPRKNRIVCVRLALLKRKNRV